MTYEGINFNETWVKGLSVDEFMTEAEVNKDAWWPNDPKRKEKAKAAYNLMVPKSKKAAVPVRAAASIDEEEKTTE